MKEKKSFAELIEERKRNPVKRPKPLSNGWEPVPAARVSQAFDPHPGKMQDIIELSFRYRSHRPL